MDEKKAQRIEKLADGILNLVIGIDVLSMLKVIPKLSERTELWLVLKHFEPWFLSPHKS